MNEDIYSLFSKEGAVGRLLTGYSSIECADPALYAITEYLIKATRTENAFIRPCELDELIRYRRKKCCFRPGDVIYYAKSVNDPRILSGAADRCVTSVASLFCACDSFCVDIAAAGAESVSEIAEGAFFVIPENAGSHLKTKIYLSCPNARECGMVTCDGLITFLKNGERYIESSRHGINALPEHERAVIGTASDYNAGALRTMKYALELLSPYAFPYELPFETRYKDALAYRLGLAAMSARGFAAAKSKAPFPVCDTVMEFIPLPYINERADIPAWHGLLKALKARASSENVAFSLTTAGNKESAGMPEIGITDSDKLSPGGSVAVLRIK